MPKFVVLYDLCKSTKGMASKNESYMNLIKGIRSLFQLFTQTDKSSLTNLQILMICNYHVLDPSISIMVEPQSMLIFIVQHEEL